VQQLYVVFCERTAGSICMHSLAKLKRDIHCIFNTTTPGVLWQACRQASRWIQLPYFLKYPAPPFLKGIKIMKKFNSIYWRIKVYMLSICKNNMYCNVCKGQFYSRWLFITCKHSTLQLSSINSTLSTLEQYLSEQPFCSSFTIPCVSQETSPTGLSQAGFSTQLKIALSSSLSHCPLTLDHKTALHTDPFIVHIPLP
jgi:hypothetical protein